MSLTRTFIAVAASDSIRHRAEQAIDRSSCLSELVDFEAGSMEVGTVAVMASQLQRGRGPIYHVLAQGALATK